MNSKTIIGLALRAGLLSALSLAGTAHAAGAKLEYISPGIGTVIATWWSMIW